jgi:bisphosphoglycerate-independent phosphoglycerate mutase (AlkP superfamily)
LFSNDFWPEPDFTLPPLTVRQAGAQLAALAREHALTFFEFWYSDLVGHRMEREQALKVLEMLDDFLAGVLERLDLTNSLLMLVSDHGNFEDWTTSKHTTNPSLTLLVGAGFQKLIPRLHSLADVKPAILTYLFE